jgi:hypothetical protein
MEQSSFGRMLSVLTSPTKTFEAIRERPTWVVVLLVTVLFAAVPWLLMADRVDMDAQRALMVEQLENRGIRGAEAEQQLEVMDRFSSGPLRYLNGIIIPIIVVFALLLTTLFYWGGSRFVGGSDVRFGQTWSTVLHASVPAIVLKSLLSLPIILSREMWNPRAIQEAGGFLPSNLAFLAPEEASAWLMVLLQRLDLFVVWTVILVVLGLAIVARISKGLAAGLAVTAWLFGTLVGGAMAKLGGMGG